MSPDRIMTGVRSTRSQQTSLRGTTSYYYKYKVDENAGTYTLVQSFEVPFSGYVSSVQECEDTILVDSGCRD